KITKLNKIDDTPLFKQNPHSFTKKYAKIINNKNYNLPKVRFHDLRHYHASLLYKNNVPDLYAAERLGHDIWVLKKIYQHLGLEEKKEIFVNLNLFLIRNFSFTNQYVEVWY
ncbi:MAG: hypothetical protein N2486_11235, partial [Caloramator sp.]|nr:hypothetical protein [Caloramator sp.]